MRKTEFLLPVLIIVIILTSSQDIFSQLRGLRSITTGDLKYQLEFISAPEFRGRQMPSPELEIASMYLAHWSENAGLKPLMKDGSFYQSIPITVTEVSQPETKLIIKKTDGEHIYYYGRGFGGSFSANGSFGGPVVFAGTGISDPAGKWDDLKDLDLRGRVVVILDEVPPGSSISYYSRLYPRIAAIRNRGAAAVLSVVTPERDSTGRVKFEKLTTGAMETLFDSQRTSFSAGSFSGASKGNTRPVLPFIQAEIGHEAAADILGITKEDICKMFAAVRKGEQISSKEIRDVRIQLDVGVVTYKSASRNVIGVVEGSDPVLKNEYIVICGHHDHIGLREGVVVQGADDNGTATVALLAIEKALLTERPKRSVIIAWFTGEEEGLNGSHFFVNNCPVPVEKISACLNMDMIGRNNPDSLFLVAPELLSSELDAAINRVNKKFRIGFGFDYRYSSPAHPQKVYFRSDQYPFIRFGIPSVWFFSGFTPDYHTPRDNAGTVDYNKFTKAVKLVYLTAFETGNMKELLKLDVNPAVTTRGKHNVTEKSLFQPAEK
jgi:hypothetical protein